MDEARTPQLLHEFFDRTASEHPDQIAVDVPPGPGRPERILLTYGDLLAQGSAAAYSTFIEKMRLAFGVSTTIVMKNEGLGPSLSYSGCPVQAYDGGEAGHREPQPAVATAAAVPLGSLTGRYAYLDIARGFAVLGMIYMHFVPAEKSEDGMASVSTALSAFLEGKAAALFCVLAGIAWEIQAQRAALSPRGRWYIPRRALALLVAGIAFHILAWPTEILVPLALMMVFALALRRMGKRALLLAAALLLMLSPAVPALLGHYVETDWTADGSHLADGTIGWVTIRALLFDGNYPFVPWLAFPLIGMLMTQRWEEPRSIKRWFGSAVAVYVVSQVLVFSVDSNADAMGSLASYLGSTWVPTSVPFVLVNGSFAIAVISGLAWWSGSRRPARVATLLALFGRASLTHYLLHICLLYLPLRAILGHEEWSAAVGVWAFVGYLVVAVPLTALWFRRFKRGPTEALWAIASGP